MKILYVLEYYHPHTGGVEKLFKSLAESLAAKGDQVTIVTNRHQKSLPKKEMIDGVKIVRLRLYNRFLFTFFSLPAVLKHARQADIIHTTSYNAALPAWIAAKILRKKIIITYHEVWRKLWFKLPFINVFQGFFYCLFERLTLKLNYDQIVAVSDSTRKTLIFAKVNPKKITRIYNGIEYPVVLKPHKQIPNFTFTYLGRLGISKGIEILIPAAKLFLEQCPNARFKFISPNKPKRLYKKLQKLIKKNGLKGKISMMHNLSENEVKKELLGSNCVVIPSHSEGFCFVAAEAVALDIPIISSGKTALNEVVSGYFTPFTTFTPETLYRSLIRAKNNDFVFKPQKKFPLEDCVKNYQDLYKKVIQD